MALVEPGGFSEDTRPVQATPACTGPDTQPGQAARGGVSDLSPLDAAKLLLAVHAVGCLPCQSATAEAETGSDCLVKMCPDGYAVMCEVYRLAAGRRGAPALSLVPAVAS